MIKNNIILYKNNASVLEMSSHETSIRTSVCVMYVKCGEVLALQHVAERITPEGNTVSFWINWAEN